MDYDKLAKEITSDSGWPKEWEMKDEACGWWELARLFEKYLQPPRGHRLEMGGMIWSPMAADMAIGILRREGEVNICGLPGPFPKGEQAILHFVLESSLKEWSDRQLESSAELQP